MKKTNVILVLICLIGIWAVSCVKENDGNYTNEKKIDKSSSAQLMSRYKSNSSGISYGGMYLLSSKAGHKSSDCGGKCKYVNGQWGHADCQGYGSECSLRASVDIFKSVPDDPDDIYYTGFGINDYEPIEDSTYSMPARSFYIENDSLENGFIWLNIPEQELLRNEESNQFIYNHITFTEEPLFDNFW